MSEGLPSWLGTLFLISQFFAVPFCVMMVFFPRWSVSKRIIPQRWWWLSVACVYVLFLVYAFAVGNAPGEVWFRIFWPTVENEQANFALWSLVSTSGTHLTFADLFIMRWIYLQERAHPWPMQLIMGISWIGGPLGLLAYTGYSALFNSRRDSLQRHDADSGSRDAQGDAH